MSTVTVVWDVETLARLIRSYRTESASAQLFGCQQADAELAVLGWRISLDRVLS